MTEDTGPKKSTPARLCNHRAISDHSVKRNSSTAKELGHGFLEQRAARGSGNGSVSAGLWHHSGSGDDPAGQSGGGRGNAGPRVVSPEVKEDRHVAFRILAPGGQSVQLNAGDIPGDSRQRALAQADNGVWELTLGPIDPGAYR